MVCVVSSLVLAPQPHREIFGLEIAAAITVDATIVLRMFSSTGTPTSHHWSPVRA
jgi:hypothetical protein